MCDDLALLEFLEADYKYEKARRRRRRLAIARRRQWLQAGPFRLQDDEFMRHYRLSKQMVLDLCEELRPMLKRLQARASNLSVEEKVLTALSFYATGLCQKPNGGFSALSMSEQTVSSCIRQVTECLNSNMMRKKYIRFPQSIEERSTIKAEFNQIFCIPNVLGCIDCMQVSIVKPLQNAERYAEVTKKNLYSLKVQLICDANKQIISVDASHGGASPKSFIWNNHPAKKHLENLNESTWLLGDSGYPLRKYLLTPIVDAANDTPDRHYTDIHARTNNTIAQTIRTLKARFRCLLKNRTLFYTPSTSGYLVNACVILHNICNKSNIPVPEVSHDDWLGEDQTDIGVEADDVECNGNEAYQMGLDTRNNLVKRLWDERAG